MTVPPIGILSAMGVSGASAFRPVDLVLFLVFYTFWGRHDDRLPPLLHAPLVRDRPGDQGDPRDPRLDDDPGPDHAMGDRPPQAPCSLRREGIRIRPTSRPTVVGDGQGLVARPIGWLFTTKGMERGDLTGGTSYATASCGRSTACISSGWPSPWAPVFDRRRDRRDWARRPRGDDVGGPDSDLLLRARDVRGELDLPHLRQAGLPGSDESVTIGWSPSSRSARGGTTTTTRFPAPPSKACAAPRSTCPSSSSLASVASAWPGRCGCRRRPSLARTPRRRSGRLSRLGPASSRLKAARCSGASSAGPAQTRAFGRPAVAKAGCQGGCLTH